MFISYAVLDIEPFILLATQKFAFDQPDELIYVRIHLVNVVIRLNRCRHLCMCAAAQCSLRSAHCARHPAHGNCAECSCHLAQN
jgi:hypothetical protein